MAALTLRPGGAEDAPRLLALFDDAVAWLAARGQTAQWGAEPFSARPSQVERVRAWAASGGLWFALPWDGVRALPSQYERLGFERVGSFDVGDWPGAILTRAL